MMNAKDLIDMVDQNASNFTLTAMQNYELITDKEAVMSEREAFEQEYQPNPNKSPFPYFLFNKETNLYEAHSFDEREVSLINAAWWGWQAQQAKIEELQKHIKLIEFIFYCKQMLIDKQRIENDEQQGRIDKALEQLQS